MQQITKAFRVVVLPINYGDSDSVVEFLRSISRVRLFDRVSTVIVDNCSKEENLSSIRHAIGQLPNVELLESPTNRGYFGAAKFGLDHYLASGRGLPDWVVVCNHDVLIEDQDFLSKLFSHDPMVAGVIAPRIRVLPSREDQNPFMRGRLGRWRRFTMRFYSFAYPLGVTWDWLSRQKGAIGAAISSWVPRSNGIPARQFIYAAHGAFMIFSRRFFEAGGSLDDQLFLFGEEIAVAETCRSLSLPVIYEPSLSVLHNEHQSVGNGMSRRMYGYHRAAVKHVLSKYFS
jgi:GT2 family glycosyltransferase